jgi:hypothetical protein
MRSCGCRQDVGLSIFCPIYVGTIYLLATFRLITRRSAPHQIQLYGIVCRMIKAIMSVTGLK